MKFSHMFTVRKATDTTFPIMLSKRDPDGWNFGALNFLNIIENFVQTQKQITPSAQRGGAILYIGGRFRPPGPCPALGAHVKHECMCINGQSSSDRGAQTPPFSSFFFLLMPLGDVTKKASLIWSSQAQQPHPQIKRKVKGEEPKQLVSHRG